MWIKVFVKALPNLTSPINSCLLPLITPAERFHVRQKVKDGTYVPYRKPSKSAGDNIMDYHCSMDDSGRNIHVEFTVNRDVYKRQLLECKSGAIA